MSIAPPSAAAMKRVLILSYFHYKNFGDRLGVPIINALLPADVQVVHAPLNFSYIPEGKFDLMILGLGQSLNTPAIINPELDRLLDRIPNVIGIFGTQYKSQYRTAMPPGRFDALIGRLTTWWARYQSDVEEFGGGRATVRHMGDWLVSAFPMAEPRFDKRLIIGPEAVDIELPLDRMIQRIQAYRLVDSARLHTLLCALTSAAEVSYTEQREAEGGEVSGKFDAMLTDIFGRTFPERTPFQVDRDAVLRYKLMVEANMSALRRQIVELLG